MELIVRTRFRENASKVILFFMEVLVVDLQDQLEQPARQVQLDLLV